MKYLIAAALLAMTSTTGMATELEPWQIKGAELAKAEPTIYDAYWNQNISLWLSMVDDGSSRNGYAEVVCRLLTDAGRPQGEFVAIRVYSYSSIRNGELNQIGKAICQ
ncbi:MAG: hypothetical protein COB39_03480 [Marinosulfonomonas sp.]|nr:MAG: hypothetical protein COB39_03480 [Marinosulfonomonas sp.]